MKIYLFISFLSLLSISTRTLANCPDRYPDGNTLLYSDGVIKFPNGNFFRLSDGTLRYSNGDTLSYRDGSMKYPESLGGEFMRGSDGSLSYPNKEYMRYKDGSLKGIDGHFKTGTISYRFDIGESEFRINAGKEMTRFLLTVPGPGYTVEFRFSPGGPINCDVIE